MTPRAPYLVVGLGNELLTDEGLGVAAARELERRAVPETDVVDGGTLGIALLPQIEDREGVLFLDAVAAHEAAPGDIVVVDQLPSGPRVWSSAHQVGVPEALAAAELAGTRPRRVAAVGMVPASLETGVGLTAVVAAGMPAMVDEALAILARWRADEVTLRA